MAECYFSTVFDQTADQVWQVIRDFGNYLVWVDGVDESYIEQDKAGDAVGAVRFVRMGETRVRQRLLAHSDLRRSYTYEFCEPTPVPLRNYQATISVRPIVDGTRAFIEWHATFDVSPDQYDHWTTFYTSSFATWLDSLRARLAML